VEDPSIYYELQYDTKVTCDLPLTSNVIYEAVYMVNLDICLPTFAILGHKTNLARPHFIEVAVPAQASVRLCAFVNLMMMLFTLY
jgi:hypothetical protein